MENKDIGNENIENKNIENENIVNENIENENTANKDTENENSEQSKIEINIEEMTIEELLSNLRNKNNWTYLDVVQELSKLGVMLEEKTIKKWEIGLEYPELDMIYKLSELYYIPAENFITAKSNSYKKGYNYIHQKFIKWFCYLTGVSFKVAYVLMYAILFIALVWSFMFFIGNCKDCLEVLQRRN